MSKRLWKESPVSDSELQHTSSAGHEETVNAIEITVPAIKSQRSIFMFNWNDYRKRRKPSFNHLTSLSGSTAHSQLCLVKCFVQNCNRNQKPASYLCFITPRCYWLYPCYITTHRVYYSLHVGALFVRTDVRDCYRRGGVDLSLPAEGRDLSVQLCG